MRTIVKILPEWNGGHASLDDVDYDLPGWAEVPAKFRPTWEAYKPFVNITVDEDGNIVDMTEGEEIKAPEVEYAPTETEQLRADVDFLAAMQGVTL